MCCLFTCCGWMIDLIQRLWTFTMSCCISSAVCCALVTASMSGIALGYNYSLAEYIDLKETNVSVYLKRGVFDDEIADDMDWRRSGRQPVAGHIGENNLRTGGFEDESTSVRSGRRLDDSLYESDDRNRFEGSLMKLTAQAPAATPTTVTEMNVNIDQILSKYPVNSVDQIKAIQSLINMRKSADSRQRIGKVKTETTEHSVDERYLPHVPAYPSNLEPGRRLMPMNGLGVYSTPSNSARFAVPAEHINAPDMWRVPKLPQESLPPDYFGGMEAIRPTYPTPVTPRAGPVRPSRPKSTPKLKPTLTTSPIEQQEPSFPKSIDEEMDSFKEKLLLEKFDAPSFKEDNFRKDKEGSRSDEEDYEDAVKGVPIRKKRHSIESKTSNNYEINRSSSEESGIKKVDYQALKKHALLNKLLTTVLSKKRNEYARSLLATSTEHKNNISTISSSLSYTLSSNIVLRLLNATRA